MISLVADRCLVKYTLDPVAFDLDEVLSHRLGEHDNCGIIAAYRDSMELFMGRYYASGNKIYGV